ncbi:MAG: pentapeptide repeat-containing protein, partial [Candidatus Hydrothermarchaeaceae archaeon]
ELIILEDKVRGTLAQIFGGLFILVGLYLTYRRIAATERNVEIAQRTLEASQEGQITERFTRAINQLGNDMLQIRLGGIYALERIAIDSERDHWPIMEVLTAYVRVQAPWREDQSEGDEPPPELRTDIQAVMHVIARRKSTFREGQATWSLDLHQVNIRMAILRGAQLQGVMFWQAHLEHAGLSGAHLEKAFLMQAHLQHASLDGAHLERADLRWANLNKANLSNAHLEGANLMNATGLTKEQIESAIIDEHTILPDYLKGSTEGKASEGGK